MKNVSIIGAGSLGSSLASIMLSNESIENIHIFDDDLIEPHNVSDLYKQADVGCFKVEVLEKKFQKVKGHKSKVHDKNIDIFTDQILENVDIIFDCRDVIGKLAGHQKPVMKMFLTGDRLVIDQDPEENYAYKAIGSYITKPSHLTINQLSLNLMTQLENGNLTPNRKDVFILTKSCELQRCMASNSSHFTIEYLVEKARRNKMGLKVTVMADKIPLFSLEKSRTCFTAVEEYYKFESAVYSFVTAYNFNNLDYYPGFYIREAERNNYIEIEIIIINGAA